MVKVWTIAIAQEKLDDVNNSNVSKAHNQSNRPFQTKIHLEATRSECLSFVTDLLRKRKQAFKNWLSILVKIQVRFSDHAAIHGAGISKTDSAENYATYYPFYKYQFGLITNFLFGN